MMTRFLAAGALLITAACATIPPAMPVGDIPVHGGGGSCEAAPAQGLVGRQATSETGAEVLRLTGATTLRWLQPDQIVTMEFREGRVNVQLDAGNRVRGITCG
ncbi:MAG TPA: I78 family peptidase inhibitor [Allosphingosinicella sp.]|uniref:I78 family peptidase inhibitor n=1 Tax=Allosphingosinicella sp. TaxID=2823234 RepID=UPI002EDB8E08